MSNLSLNYVSFALAESRAGNPGTISYTSSLNGNEVAFVVNRTTLSLNATTSSLNQNKLQLETSDVYPYKVVVARNEASASVVYVPTSEIFVTASQNYYVPLRFNRYQPSIIRALDTAFTELETTVTTTTESPGE